MSRLRHFDNLGTARFVTFSCFRFFRLLIEESFIGVFLEELEKARIQYSLSILGYVVMPNHVHLVLLPRENIKLGSVIGLIKAQSARRILKICKNDNPIILKNLLVVRNRRKRYVFWQRRCYDHNCRTIEAVREMINYCHMNPVKAGLVDNPDEWPWSSYRWYLGDMDSIVEIDDVELYV